MIATLVIVAIVLAAFVVTLRGGVAACFTCVMMPAVVLVFTVAPLDVFKLPDISTLGAVGYGTVAALVVRGAAPLPFRFHLIDALVVGLSLIAVVSAVVSEELWTGVSTGGAEALEWVTPYFMARATFAHREWRVAAAKVLAGLACFIALVSLVELRFVPLFFSRNVLRPFGLTSVAYDLVLKRFSLFRAQATFSHPIDLGNGGAIMGCMILVLAGTAGRTLRTPWVLAGVLAAATMTAASISFTAIVAIGGVVGIFAACRLSRLAGLALPPIAVAAVVGYSLLTVYFVQTPMPVREWSPDATLNDSYSVRQMIVQYAWPWVSTAGFFGYGKTVSPQDMGLESVDNGYLLFVVRRGWLYLSVFVLLLLSMSVFGGRAILRVHDGVARMPVAAGVGGLLGIMMGMYTVFFGFVYAELFVILMGLTVTMCQEVFARSDRAAAAELAPAAAPRRAPAARGRRLATA